jgi:hypothetical protein
MDAERLVLVLFGLCLFASPFVLAWGIWSFVAPVSALERLGTLLLILFTCGGEGVVAWLAAFTVTKVALD